MIKRALTKIFSSRHQRTYAGTADGSMWLGGPNNSATGYNVTTQMARRVSAVFAAQRAIANGVACLPCKPIKELKGGGKEVARKHELYKMMSFAPNRYQDPIQFWTMLVLQILDNGNSYWQKIYNGGGKLNELYPLLPENMDPKFTTVNSKETLVYEYRLPNGDKKLFQPDEIFHATGMIVKGVKGIGVVDNAIETIAHSMAIQEQSSRYFSNGVRPSGILKIPGALQKQDTERIKESWQKAYGGGGNAWNVAILEKGLEWQPMGLTNEQSQFLETRKFDVSEIARWFGVPPHMIGDLDKATFSNIEEQSEEFIRDCIRPWCERIEAAVKKQLIGEDFFEDYSLEFVLEGMMRGKTLDRYQAHQIALNNGIMCIDEVREIENRNPLPDGTGKIYTQQMNVQPVDPNLREKAPESDPNATNNGQNDGNNSDNGGNNSQNDGKNGDNANNNSDKTAKKEKKKHVLEAMKTMICSNTDRALRREASARRKNNDPKMVEFLKEDFRKVCKAIIHAHETDTNTVKTRDKDNEVIITRVLEVWADQWTQTSERELDTMNEWEATRSRREVETLTEMIKAEIDRYEG